MTRSQFYRNAQSKRYAWAKAVDPQAVTKFEARAMEQRPK